jgi:hypothetical protein
VLWSYYSPTQVRFVSEANATQFYMWGEKTLEFHRCRNCGCVTHWAPVDNSSDRMGINARLVAPEFLVVARIRHLDGADTWKYLNEAREKS